MPLYSSRERNRARVATLAQGLSGESFNRSVAAGNYTHASGDQRATVCGFFAGDIITSVYVHVLAAAASPTLVRMGVWDSSGTLLASSATLHAGAFASGTGVKGGALSAAYTVPADGGYYLGICYVGGAGPSLLRGTSGITGYTAPGLSPGAAGSVSTSSLADIGAMTMTGSGTAPWVGWN